MFIEKSLEEISKMSIEDQSVYMAEKKEHENKVRKEEVEAQIAKAQENNASKEDVSKLEGLVSELKDALIKNVLTIKNLKQGNNGEVKVATIESEITENKEELKSIAKGLSSKEVIIKADTVRANVVGNQNALDLAGIGQLAHAKLTAYDIFTKIPVSDKNTNGVIRYYDWDSATTVRAADTRAEGAIFPESTAKWVTKTLPIEKIGDTLPVSEEFFEDDSMFAAELGMFLDTNVKIKRNDQIVNGNGTTPNLKGIVATVPTYTAPTAGISDANIYDLFVKVSEDITATGGSKYSPDFGLMNIVDINAMKLKKDANENYVIPPFVSKDGSSVAGMIVLEENTITANTMVIGDRRYARIYERAGIALTRGLIGNQFTEDMETLKVRTRLAFLIRGADEGGFRKVTSISAALVLLAT